jgi:hypothetical protein
MDLRKLGQLIFDHFELVNFVFQDVVCLKPYLLEPFFKPALLLVNLGFEPLNLLGVLQVFGFLSLFELVVLILPMPGPSLILLCQTLHLFSQPLCLRFQLLLTLL